MSIPTRGNSRRRFLSLIQRQRATEQKNTSFSFAYKTVYVPKGPRVVYQRYRLHWEVFNVRYRTKPMITLVEIGFARI